VWIVDEGIGEHAIQARVSRSVVVLARGLRGAVAEAAARRGHDQQRRAVGELGQADAATTALQPSTVVIRIDAPVDI
jgi:hypothetical protein